MKYNRRSFLKKVVSTSAVGAGALAIPSVVQAQDTVKWKMQSLWDGGTTPQKFEEIFVQRVAELTDNRFQIQLYSAGDRKSVV